jgi:hypothetical protein
MSAHHRADGIDLQQAGAGQYTGEVPAVRRTDWAGIEKPLGGKRDAPGHGERDLFLHAGITLRAI